MENGQAIELATTNGAAPKQATTTLARVPTAGIAYEPRSSAEAYQMAVHFAKSGLLGDINTPEKAFLIMATGADLGIPATTALRMISIVKGKPVLAADLMVAMCLSKPDRCEFFDIVSIDEKQCTVRTKRRGREIQTASFTVAEAEKAKLLDKGGDRSSESNWGKWLQDMLYHRASARLARRTYPDIVGGLYCKEEADEIREEQRTVEAEAIETRGADELQERIDGFLARIANAQTMDDLKSVRMDSRQDPASEVVVERIRSAHDARKQEIEAKAG